jgi:DNA-binding beta-propeller fold protein YncE
MRLFFMNSGQARTRLVQAGSVLAAVALVAGCGSQYRPVVTPISPSGPAAQPSSLAVVVSAPSPTTAGIATLIDYSGDTVMATAPIGPGPINFTIDETGSTGYTVNSDGTLTNFPVSTTNLQAKNVTYTTLPTTAQPVGLFAPSTGMWAADLDGSIADVLSQASSGTMAFKLAIPVAPTPVAIYGPAILGSRNYSISLNNASTPTASIVPYKDMTCNTAPSTATQYGEADSLEIASYTVAARIPLGKCPVFAVESSDQKRFFVLNRGSDTVTVINSQNNTLDTCTPFLNQSGQTVTCHPSLPLSTTAGLAQDANNYVSAVAGPVYAEYNAAKSLLVVANYDGGTISVIDVSLDEYGNDSPTFGTTFTIPVGKNPASVTVLYDGSRAYTANQADGTVTIVNLSSHTVEKSLTVVGHPRTVVSTQNSSYGKVYVASPDSPYLTILRTDQDIVDTTVLVEGNVVDVRVTTQNGTSGNVNVNSRRPGAGQPCYLPPSLEPAPTGTQTAFDVCQTMP